MEKMYKSENGITLEVLVITIIILLILAGISISALTSDNGLFTRAKQAKQNTEDAQNVENLIIDDYQNKINEIVDGEVQVEPVLKKVKEVQGQVISTTKNTTVEDEYKNRLVVPAGFKITTDASVVTQGIVITDGTNEFVWIPVGNIKKADGSIIKIELNRYSFDENGKATAQGEAIIVKCQELATSTLGNTTAIDIEAFKTSVTNNKGYYIGRYEVGKEGESTAVCKSGVAVYHITQPNAAQKAREMYNSTEFTSDLMNSYAWDTTIVFEQLFGTNSKYSRQNSFNTYPTATTGTSGDVQCNIYDMAINVAEWTTETRNFTGYYCSHRGGSCWHTDFYTDYRGGNNTSLQDAGVGFRPILYM